VRLNTIVHRRSIGQLGIQEFGIVVGSDSAVVAAAIEAVNVVLIVLDVAAAVCAQAGIIVHWSIVAGARLLERGEAASPQQAGEGLSRRRVGKAGE
jgi:hypothetical protein